MQAEYDIMAHPTGIGGDALLSTLVNHVASREGVIEAAELELIFGIVSSLAGRISPDALVMAQAKLSALVTAQEHDLKQPADSQNIEAAVIETQPSTGSPAHHLNDIEQQPFVADMRIDDAAHEVVNEDCSGATCQIDCLAEDATGQLNLAEADTDLSLETTAQIDLQAAPEDEYHLSFNDILDQPHLDQPLVASDIMLDDACETVALVAAPADVLALAAICQPAELVALASVAAPSAQLCNLIVARGHPEALAAIARNPAAQFAKSSFTTMVELAASDFSIRQALCSRADLGDMILERLWPYLSQSSRSFVVAAGCRESHAEAVLLCADALQAAQASDSDMDDVRSAAEWTAAIEAGHETLCQAMRTLDGEGRIVDVAMVLAARSKLSPEMALTMMLGTYDRCAIVLARLAGCDDDSLVSLMHVRGRAGARSTADKRGPLHAFSRMSEDEAIGLVRSMERQLSPKSAPLNGGQMKAAQVSPGPDQACDGMIPIAA